MLLIYTGENRVTIPFKFKKMNTWVVRKAMRKEVYRKNAEPAVGGIPDTVAIRIQMIPLRVENSVNGLRGLRRENMPTLPVSKGGVQHQMRYCCH